MSMRALPLWCSLLSCVAALGCSEDPTPAKNNTPTADMRADMVSCVDGEVLDPRTNRCVPVFIMPDMPDMRPMVDMNQPDQDQGPDLATPDMAPDPCDKDFDTYRAATPECGGDDCDDDNPFIHPGRDELCDDLDNNCNGQLNERLECEFFANTRDALYKIDPFKKTARKLIDLEFSLQDIDTTPQGVLYGIDADNLYRYEPGIGLTVVGGGLRLSNSGTINGLAIDRDGKVFATGTNRLYEVDISDSASSSYGRGRLVGQMAQDVTSSGDCVINKGNTLFMTSKKAGEKDSLVRITHTASSAEATIIGDTGFSSIFGLTAAWGKLYGVNTFGELIVIDERTGQGTLLHTFPDLRFFGAASSPSR